MDLFKVIEERLSYRGSYRSEPVPETDLIKIVEAGLNAPSGKNAQTTEFVIINDPEKISQIRQFHPTNKAMKEAQVYIACVVDSIPEATYEGYDFQIEDCAAAVENMLLAITALGYASVWIDGWLRLEKRAEKIGKIVGIPEGKKIRVILPIGTPAEEGTRRKKKTFSDRAWFNTYRGN